jgi:hypothetical protein
MNDANALSRARYHDDVSMLHNDEGLGQVECKRKIFSLCRRDERAQKLDLKIEVHFSKKSMDTIKAEMPLVYIHLVASVQKSTERPINTDSKLALGTTQEERRISRGLERQE